MKEPKIKTSLSTAKIQNQILKFLKLALLKQQEFLNEFNFKFFNASETDVRKKSRFFCFIKHCVLCEKSLRLCVKN
jgi:hypothetical protein